MSFKKICLVALLFGAVSVFAAQSPEEDVSKARLLLSPNRWVQMHYFLQAGTAFSFNDDYVSKNDYYVNHNRLILNGQTADKFFFFFQTEDFSVNSTQKTGDSPLYVQDAFINYEIADSFQIFAGQMPLPFSRMNNQSAATTLTNDLDQNASSLYNYSNDGRDTGILFRGFLFQRYLEYRVGMFRGQGREEFSADPDNPDSETHTINEGDWPRFTGRLQVHIADREDGFFYSENYLGKRDVFAFGIGYDFQPGVCDKSRDGDPRNYFAMTVDVTADKSIAGGNSFALQGALTYGQGNPSDSDRFEDLDYKNYVTIYVQCGMLMASRWQPFARYAMSNRLNAKDSGKGGNYVSHVLSTGLNYFIDGHNANLRAQYDLPLGDGSNKDGEHKLSLQMQCYL